MSAIPMCVDVASPFFTSKIWEMLGRLLVRCRRVAACPSGTGPIHDCICACGHIPPWVLRMVFWVIHFSKLLSKVSRFIC